MKTLRLILGDQLSHDISSLRECSMTDDTILMCEVWDETKYVKHHKKKIAFLFSAMRHFAEELKQKGHDVKYVQLDDPDNSGSFRGEVARALGQNRFDQIVVTFPGEYRVFEDIKGWEQEFKISVCLLEDDRFLCTRAEFAEWADKKQQLRMEYFYRYMRQKHNILLEQEEPIGGKWNYDSENRKPPVSDLKIPETYKETPDHITAEVLQLVEDRFGDHFGDLEPFHFAVTRSGALQALDQFLKYRLQAFGDFQDAMLTGQPWMYHSHISFYLNCGLLSPAEVIAQAEGYYKKGLAPLNAVEGFIRQILGWREFVRGLYWLKMPAYKKANIFEADRSLPDFYWHGQTKMNCLRQCVLETRQNAYAHHIQRLMVLGNFALLAGISPDEVNEWFLIVYADAYEWVELPNVTGMILFADGGVLASKPYAASGAYIHKMSNYCETCSYKVTKKNGANACPFNYLYWDFLARNRSVLEKNHRVGMMYRTYDRMTEEKKRAISEDSRRFLKGL